MAVLAALCAFGEGDHAGRVTLPGGEEVCVADCVRDPKLDYWAASDVEFCRRVMTCVLTNSHVTPRYVEFGKDGLIETSKVDVICSAFRTPELLQSYDFPLQPLGRMHYALYATPARAMSMMSTKITEWPRMRVGYSPVAQGRNNDRTDYFEHAKLSPEYIEYPTSEGAVKALREGEVDALFLYTPFSKRPKELVEIVPIGARGGGSSRAGGGGWADPAEEAAADGDHPPQQDDGRADFKLLPEHRGRDGWTQLRQEEGSGR